MQSPDAALLSRSSNSTAAEVLALHFLTQPDADLGDGQMAATLHSFNLLSLLWELLVKCPPLADEWQPQDRLQQPPAHMT